MRQAHTTHEVTTRGRGLFEFTADAARFLSSEKAGTGVLTVFIRHTSASLLIQENADPDVKTDLDRWLSRLVKDGDPLFEHTAEGPDDMPSHVRAALTQVHLSIPVVEGRMALGTWQGLYVYEHRTHGHRRTLLFLFQGEFEE